VRVLGRLTAVAIGVLVLLLVGVQFARIVGQNVAMAEELNSIRSDVSSLEKRRIQQLREMHRLEDPEGAVPEIHDRLRMVGAKETIIFVSPLPSAAP
jgi:cell division protein FtsB